MKQQASETIDLGSAGESTTDEDDQSEEVVAGQLSTQEVLARAEALLSQSPTDASVNVLVNVCFVVIIFDPIHGY